ncbi:hypothetical protein BLL52_0485 [Rhodoferax antarcticus ANT.BR]|uniref:Uncharacterized protein n=1 Tax=Rhodoferax antarcticus ANT.BR TaxID=1111071 RepID=A0A1Q8YJS2_9BURK|nr:hypothetical protein BLL52_0485 [Rhodoferax antarcticus ANT.BR]
MLCRKTAAKNSHTNIDRFHAPDCALDHAGRDPSCYNTCKTGGDFWALDF